MSGLRRNIMAASRGAGVDWESMMRQVISGEGDIAEFVFPSGITTLKQYALMRTNFQSVTIPDSVQISSGREYGFIAYNTYLTHIDFGSGLTRIDEQFCRGCTALTSVTIPEQITSIAYMAFQGCSSLSRVIVQRATPPSITQTSFQNTALSGIYVPDGSVAAYKAASGWSTYASIIKGISERPTT